MSDFKAFDDKIAAEIAKRLRASRHQTALRMRALNTNPSKAKKGGMTLDAGAKIAPAYMLTLGGTRSSRYLSENTKERYHQCQNINCGHTFKTMESFDGSIMRPGHIVAVMPHPTSHGQQTFLM